MPIGARAERIAAAFGDVNAGAAGRGDGRRAPQERCKRERAGSSDVCPAAGPQTRSVALGGALLGTPVGFCWCSFLDYIDGDLSQLAGHSGATWCAHTWRGPWLVQPARWRAEPAAKAARAWWRTPGHQKGRA
jgi:hypothetical protein